MEKWLQSLHSSFNLGLSWLGERKQKTNLPGTQIFPVASLGAQAAGSPLWAFGTLRLGFLMELLLVCTAERRETVPPGKGKLWIFPWQEGEVRHSRPKSLPHVLLVSSVSHVHGEPLFLISS